MSSNPSMTFLAFSTKINNLEHHKSSRRPTTSPGIGYKKTQKKLRYFLEKARKKWRQIKKKHHQFLNLFFQEKDSISKSSPELYYNKGIVSHSIFFLFRLLSAFTKFLTNF